MCVCVCVCVCVYVCVCVLVAQSCPTLRDPMDCSPPGSSVHGIPQARILERVAIPFSRGFPQTRDCTRLSCIAGRYFTVWATRIIHHRKRKTEQQQTQDAFNGPSEPQAGNFFPLPISALKGYASLSSGFLLDFAKIARRG